MEKQAVVSERRTCTHTQAQFLGLFIKFRKEEGSVCQKDQRCWGCHMMLPLRNRTHRVCVHRQRGSCKESLENSRGKPNPTPEVLPLTNSPSQKLKKSTAKLALFFVLPCPLLSFQHSNWTNNFLAWRCQGQGALPGLESLLRMLSCIWKKHLLCKSTDMPNNPFLFPGALSPACIKISQVNKATGCGPS